MLDLASQFDKSLIRSRYPFLQRIRNGAPESSKSIQYAMQTFAEKQIMRVLFRTIKARLKKTNGPLPPGNFRFKVFKCHVLVAAYKRRLTHGKPLARFNSNNRRKISSSVISAV